MRLSKLMGVEVLVVTNAAGGVNPQYKPGDLMIINDHINFPGMAGFHPLKGPNLEEFGPRFQPLSDAYELDLRKLFFSKKKELGITRNVFEGTYFLYLAQRSKVEQKSDLFNPPVVMLLVCQRFQKLLSLVILV